MYPLQNDSAIPHLPHSDEPPCDPCPIVLSSPRFEITPQPPLDGNYYPSQYQQPFPDAYPQPCLQQYPQYPPQLHIHTDLSLRYHDPQSPYASASTSTTYPPPTPPSVGPQSALSEHTEYVYASPDCQTVPVHQVPYRDTHLDAPAGSLWPQSRLADTPQQLYPYPQSDPEQLDTSPQWSTAYNIRHSSPPYTPPALSYYPDSHVNSQPDGEQFAVSNMYSEEAPYPHAPQYTSSPLSQSVHDQHQGALPSQIMHESPTSLSHDSGSFDHTSHVHLSPEQVPPVNLELKHHAPFIPQAPPPRESIFDSPLREPLHNSIEEALEYPEYQYRSPLLDPPVEQVFTHDRQVETGFQEHPPPALYSEAGSSWASPSAGDYQHLTYVPPVLDQHEQYSSPHSSLGLHPLPKLSPSVQPPGLPHVQVEPPFQRTLRRSPLHEERLSRVHSPAREPGRGSIQGPIQPPQLLEPDPIPRLSQPCRNSRTPSISSPGPGPSAQAPFSTSRRTSHSRSPPTRSRSPQTDGQLLQAPVVPSQSHLAIRRHRGNRTQSQAFRPFHPYPSHQRGEHSNQRVQYSEATFVGGSGTRGVCIPPTPVFGLFGSYPLSRGPREQPLPGPTCAPESSSSVMRLVLTPPFKRPPPPPPPPPTLPVRRPRMACFFCRKRKIACGPGPSTSPRSVQGGKDDDEKKEEDPPCNQCARRGLECDRPTESKRGVRRGKGREKDGEGGENDESAPGASGSHITLELAPRPRPSNAEKAPFDVGSNEVGDLDDANGDDDISDEDPSGDGANASHLSEEK